MHMHVYFRECVKVQTAAVWLSEGLMLDQFSFNSSMEIKYRKL